MEISIAAESSMASLHLRAFLDVKMDPLVLKVYVKVSYLDMTDCLAVT